MSGHGTRPVDGASGRRITYGKVLAFEHQNEIKGNDHEMKTCPRLTLAPGQKGPGIRHWLRLQYNSLSESRT